VQEELVAEFQSRFPRFAQELGPDNLKSLLGACTAVDIPPGRRLFRDRMPVDSLYMILEGELTVSVQEGEKTLELAIVKPGEWLGEVSVLSGELLASSTVVARTPVKLLRMRHQAFEDLMLKHQPIASILLRQLVSMLADRLRATSMAGGQLAALRKTAAQESPAIQEASRKAWLASFFGNTGT
jgi:CRP-like cAMP-binding protein